MENLPGIFSPINMDPDKSIYMIFCDAQKYILRVLIRII